MAAHKISDLPLYHEDRACKTPTAKRILEVLDPLARTIIRHDNEVLAVHAPRLDPLQRRILELLDIPPSAYGTT